VAGGALAERRAAFRAASSSLAARINLLLSLGPEKLERLALRTRMRDAEASVEPDASAARPDAVVVLLSDVHGNLPALQSVLLDIDGRGDATAVYHLGDLVGYAPWPNEVVEVLVERGIHGVAGNYDSTVATDYEHCGCRYEDPEQEALSHLSFAWTKQNTTPSTKLRLGALPFRLDVRPLGGHTGGPRVILVHGNPTLNTFYWTEDRDDAFCLKMAEQTGARPGDLIAFGHTHNPWHRVVEGIHFVNTGSVGRPKDGDPRAGYVRVTLLDGVFDVDHVRVEYDVEHAMRGIRGSALPAEFAEQLRRGGKVS
jgi:predicted phosphodiesterase